MAGVAAGLLATAKEAGIKDPDSALSLLRRAHNAVATGTNIADLLAAGGQGAGAGDGRTALSIQVKALGTYAAELGAAIIDAAMNGSQTIKDAVKNAEKLGNANRWVQRLLCRCT